jgi:prevent-host-death family protein
MTAPRSTRSGNTCVLDHGHDYGPSAWMDPVSKSALKAKMLEYFRRVEETGEELVVTDNNQPTLRIVPIRRRVPASMAFADVRGQVVYTRTS